MPDTSPLRPGDPESIGSYRLLGRLGDGGQGVVYLGENASGDRFAVKWLRAELAGDPVGRERFLREVAAAQRVAAFCTAQIVETGVVQERPYIVSEYIPGPSLQELVSTSGPRTGPSLHRLAVGTATALTAIHQAGIVHRDLKPANVLMGPDGPRVIDFGIAKALDSAATVTSRPIGTPSYMSPEQFTAGPVGPPADMFAWACTMVYAATGEPPFGGDMVAAVIHRILTTTPDLDRLHGTLREVVAACLEKDPARRPTAEQVLLRLLQQDTPGPAVPRQPAPGPAVLRQAAAVAAQPDGGPPRPGATPPPPPGPPPTHPQAPFWPPAGTGGSPPLPEPTTVPGPRRSPGRKLAIAGTAAAVALALAVAGIVYVFNGQGRTVAADGTSATNTSTASTPTASAATAAPALPTQNLTEKQLTGTQATVYEHPDDKISLAYYATKIDGQDATLYTSRTDSFTRTQKYWWLSVSPDRRLEAASTKEYESDGSAAVDIIDRQTGRIRAIKTVKKPLTYSWALWPRDSRRLLLTIRDPRPKDGKTLGFIVVDTEAGTAQIKRIDDAAIENSAFFWSGDATQVVTYYKVGNEYGLRFYNLDGKKAREIIGIGEPYTESWELFSPSGRSFVTRCPEGERGDCVWDAATGGRTATVHSSCTVIIGWYDDSHLMCWARIDDNYQVHIIDLEGNSVRVLLKENLQQEKGPEVTNVQFLPKGPG